MTEDENFKAGEQYEQRRQREHLEFQAIFTLAEIGSIEWYRLENNYWPAYPSYFALRTPWYLVKTDFGLIKIGWRKRVINIDWSDTGIRHVVTADEVTKNETMVHAWTKEKAIEYLKSLRTFKESQ